VTFSTPATGICERSGAFHKTYNLAARLRTFVQEHDVQECLESLDGSPLAENLNTMISADRIIRQFPVDRVIKIMAGVLKFWETLLAQTRPDIIVGEVACATEWAGYQMAQSLDIPYLIPCVAPVPNRFFFTRSPQGSWESAHQKYTEMKGRELSSEEIVAAEEFLQVFRAGKARHPFFRYDRRSPVRVDVKQLSRRLERAPYRVRTYIKDGEFEVGSYDGTPPWESVWHDIRKALRHLVYEKVVFKQAMPVTGKEIYFPLHMQPEYTTDVRAPFLTNQLALIDNIAKSIPIGYRLVVKDHPAMSGERDIGYYRSLQKLYNVDLVSPYVDGHDLIKRSAMNVTITGTTAWESILYERPVVAFGPLFYGYFDLVTHCREVSDLPALLPEIIKTFAPDRRLLLKFIASFLTTAHTFEWGSAIRIPGVNERQNLERIATAIIMDGVPGVMA
jgi:hypothetical protein